MSYLNRKWKVSFEITDESGDFPVDVKALISEYMDDLFESMDMLKEDRETLVIEEKEPHGETKPS